MKTPATHAVVIHSPVSRINTLHFEGTFAECEYRIQRLRENSKPSSLNTREIYPLSEMPSLGLLK